MTNSITPPPELVGQWQDESPEMQIADHVQYLIARAAQWGADQELEACCEWLDERAVLNGATALRTARRPKPPSLKELALAALNEIQDHMLGPTNQEKLIRRALEALDD
jgi:hypothetical protein